MGLGADGATAVSVFPATVCAWIVCPDLSGFVVVLICVAAGLAEGVEAGFCAPVERATIPTIRRTATDESIHLVRFDFAINFSNNKSPSAGKSIKLL